MPRLWDSGNGNLGEPPRAAARMVGVVGFEPTTSCSQSTCATTALHPDGFVLTKRMCFGSDALKTSLQRSNRTMPGRSAVTPDVKRAGRGARESVWI